MRGSGEGEPDPYAVNDAGAARRISSFYPALIRTKEDCDHSSIDGLFTTDKTGKG